jgi:hypothetical protein
MKRLCRRLSIPTYEAVGLLESLWHLCARETPRGDIGKLSDDDIGIGIDYRGEAADMLAALVDCRWLDAHPQHRLLIHDWPDHCDDSVNMKLARAKQFFADGRPPKLTRLGAAEKEAAAQFYTATPDPGPTPCAQKDGSHPPEPETKDDKPTLCAQTNDPCAQKDDPCARRAPRLDLDPALTLTLTPPERQITCPDSRKSAAKSGQAYEGRADDHQQLSAVMTEWLGYPVKPGEVDPVLAELPDTPLQGFLRHLDSLAPKFKPGGSNPPRKPGWFVSTARNYAKKFTFETPDEEKCRHGKAWNACSICLPPEQFDRMTNALDRLDAA